MCSFVLMQFVMLCRSGPEFRSSDHINADKLSFAAFVFKLHYSLDQREERVVFSAADIFAGLPFRAPLTRKNVAAEHVLSAEFLKPQPLCR